MDSLTELFAHVLTIFCTFATCACCAHSNYINKEGKCLPYWGYHKCFLPWIDAFEQLFNLPPVSLFLHSPQTPQSIPLPWLAARPCRADRAGMPLHRCLRL